MKKFFKAFLVLSILMTMILGGAVFAGEKEYIIKERYVFKNERNGKLKSGFVQLLVGQIDFTQYSDDDYVKITPVPDKTEVDKLGNMYAYYDAEGMRKNEKLIITVERKAKISDYDVEGGIVARANGTVTEDNQIYIEPQVKIESDDKKIIEKANEITEGLTSDYRKAEAIFKFVNTKIDYETGSDRNKGALATLESKKGVCEDFATLFVALCRAEEIPARVVVGYKVEVEYRKEVPISHAWAEIYLDDYGWVPVEPTVIYTVQTINESGEGRRSPYWKTFCALDKVDHIPVGVFAQETAEMQFQIVTDQKDEFKTTLMLAEDSPMQKQNTFQDISAYTWAGDAIQNLYALDIVNGYAPTTYGPERNISRIEFICMLSRALKHLEENNVEKANVYYYPTYDEEHWSKEDYDFLMRCYQFYTPSDIMSAGYFNLASVFGDNFYMDRAITRGEVVALMDAFLKDTEETISFNDVYYNTPFAGSIAKAYANELINGYPDGTFKPNNTITRAEIATILNRLIASNTYNY